MHAGAPTMSSDKKFEHAFASGTLWIDFRKVTSTNADDADAYSLSVKFESKSGGTYTSEYDDAAIRKLSCFLQDDPTILLEVAIRKPIITIAADKKTASAIFAFQV